MICLLIGSGFIFCLLGILVWGVILRCVRVYLLFVILFRYASIVYLVGSLFICYYCAFDWCFAYVVWCLFAAVRFVACLT